jgi:hypothetical protein
MANAILKRWLLESLTSLGGQGTIVEICRDVSRSHSADLEAEGDLLFTWQYDIRWAATTLRQEGVLKAANESPRGVWELAA